MKFKQFVHKIKLGVYNFMRRIFRKSTQKQIVPEQVKQNNSGTIRVTSSKIRTVKIIKT